MNVDRRKFHVSHLVEPTSSPLSLLEVSLSNELALVVVISDDYSTILPPLHRRVHSSDYHIEEHSIGYSSQHSIVLQWPDQNKRRETMNVIIMLVEIFDVFVIKSI